MSANYPMSSNYTEVGYGLSAPLQNLYSPPIVSKRAPTTRDKFQIGQLWVNTLTNNSYILTSIVTNAAQWQVFSVNADFAGNVAIGGTLTVTGATILNDTLSVVNLASFGGDIDVTGDVVGASLVALGDTGDSGALTTTFTASVTANAGVVAGQVNTSAAQSNDGWINIYVGVTPAFIPYWTAV